MELVSRKQWSYADIGQRVEHDIDLTDDLALDIAAAENNGNFVLAKRLRVELETELQVLAFERITSAVGYLTELHGGERAVEEAAKLLQKILQQHPGSPKRKWISRKLRLRIFERDEFQCVECGESRRALLRIDHIVPVRLGGGNALANLQTLCRDCNAEKAGELK